MVVARPRCLLGVISNRRCESIVTPSDFRFGATCSLLPATLTSRILAEDRSAVPRMTTSDLSLLSCRSLCKTTVKQRLSIWQTFESRSSVSDVHGDEQLRVVSKLMIRDAMRLDELSDRRHVCCEEQWSEH